MRHHRNKIRFKFFHLAEEFILLIVLPATPILDDQAVGDEEIIAEEDGEEGAAIGSQTPKHQKAKEPIAVKPAKCNPKRQDLALASLLIQHA